MSEARARLLPPQSAFSASRPNPLADLISISRRVGAAVPNCPQCMRMSPGPSHEGSRDEDEFLDVEQNVSKVGPRREKRTIRVRHEELQGVASFHIGRKSPEGLLIRDINSRGVAGILKGKESTRPEFRLFDHERVVHEDESLRGNIRDVATPHGRGGGRKVERHHHGRQKVSANVDINASTPVAVLRPRFRWSTSPLHKRCNLWHDAGAAERGIKSARNKHHGIPDALGFQASRVHPVEKTILGIANFPRGIQRTRHAIGPGKDHLPMHRFDRPSVIPEFRRQPVQQFRVRWRFAHHAEVVGRFDDPDTEMAFP